MLHTGPQSPTAWQRDPQCNGAHVEKAAPKLEATLGHTEDFHLTGDSAVLEGSMRLKLSFPSPDCWPFRDPPTAQFKVCHKGWGGGGLKQLFTKSLDDEETVPAA